MSNTNDARLLSKVAILAKDLRESKRRIIAEYMAQARAELASKEQNYERSVIEALEGGVRVTDIARAASKPGVTPNRNEIYRIKRDYESSGRAYQGHEEYPFRWVSEDIDGVTVYGVTASTWDFGPEKISGEYRWTHIAGELEPVFDPVNEPYPTGKYYRQILDQWLLLNPYPGEGSTE